MADLPSTQLQALFVLNVTPPLSMSVLARKLAISKQQLTKIADALVARGCVSRSSDEKNRRVILLSLTEEAGPWCARCRMRSSSGCCPSSAAWTRASCKSFLKPPTPSAACWTRSKTDASPPFLPAAARSGEF